jgi:antitoxin CcdA
MGKVELRVQIDADLLESAKAAGVDFPVVTEEAVRAALAQRSDEAKARRWAEENAEAIKAHRERIETYGVFGEDLRTW